MSAVPVDTAKFGALASMVAKNLDEIPDLPEFVCPPPGTYKLIIEKVGQKEINKKTALVVDYVVAATLALNDAEGDKERVVAEGSKFSEAFYFDDPEKVEMTLGLLKLKFAGLSTAAGSTNLLDILGKMEGMQVQAVITNRQDKKDSSKLYPSTKDIIPAV